jgi:hypothetical protein
MKKIRIISLAALLVAACFLCNSCYGPFRLTNKLYTWNGTVGNKWANTGVFLAFVILPVYGVTLVLDGIIFNSIEFWGGSNPISMEEGEMEQKIVKSGDSEYLLTLTKNKMLIESMDKGVSDGPAEILFVPEEQSCYLNYRGATSKILEYLPSGDGEDQVRIYLPDGSDVIMAADQRDPEVIKSFLEPHMNLLVDR